MPAAAPAPGMYLLHKPVGPTSFDLVKQFVAANPQPPHASCRAPRVCHGGVLDPFASGLLLILVEPATRLFDYLHDVPKTYTATIAWGAETDTGDHLGRVTTQSSTPPPTLDQLNSAIALFRGWTEQTPPATSNKRIAGERAYLKAHRGEEVALPPSRVYLHDATWLNENALRLTVRGGFYVRALVRDLGRQLGCGAHITQLHRDAIGPYRDLQQHVSAYASPITGRNLLPWLPTRLLTDQDIGDLRQKRNIPRQAPNPFGDPLLPPDWPLPPGFPTPESGLPIRGFHRDRFCFLLHDAGDDKLKALAPLRGL